MEAGKEPSVGNSVLPDHSRNSSIRKTSKGTSTTYGALLLKGSRILCSREEKKYKTAIPNEGKANVKNDRDL